MDHASAGGEFALKLSEEGEVVGGGLGGKFTAGTMTIENLRRMVKKNQCVAEICLYFRKLSTESVHVPTEVLNEVNQSFMILF